MAGIVDVNALFDKLSESFSACLCGYVYTRALCSIEQVDCRTPGSDSDIFFLSGEDIGAFFALTEAPRGGSSTDLLGLIAPERPIGTEFKEEIAPAKNTLTDF